MTIEDLRNRNLIILECISGSRAYGLDTPNSDTDIKGIFILPKKDYYGLDYIPQINNESNDIVFYELCRFMQLLSVNNPNILELLNTPADSIIYKHPYLDEIKTEIFLSKLCQNTFGRFALSQIKKAKGLNKKIVNPVAKERKSILSFCHVNYGNGSIPLLKYLEINNFNQENCGLVNIPNMKDLYGLYYSEEHELNGIIKSDQSNEVSLSSIPKEINQIAIMYFNKDAYSTYCKDYHQYWEWVEKRNDVRYENTISHGKNYDSKNMMHVFRLLDMAIEIGKFGKVNVRRPNREFLLDIKAGKFDYDDLINLSNQKQEEMELAFQNSNLQEEPNLLQINELTYIMRDKFYQDKKYW